MRRIPTTLCLLAFVVIALPTGRAFAHCCHDQRELQTHQRSEFRGGLHGLGEDSQPSLPQPSQKLGAHSQDYGGRPSGSGLGRLRGDSLGAYGAGSKGEPGPGGLGGLRDGGIGTPESR